MKTPAELSARFLRKELYVVRTRPVVPREKLETLLAEHLEHQIALEKRGVLFAAGPLLHLAAEFRLSSLPL